jgi:hypothetical protein
MKLIMASIKLYIGFLRLPSCFGALPFWMIRLSGYQETSMASIKLYIGILPGMQVCHFIELKLIASVN